MQDLLCIDLKNQLHTYEREIYRIVEGQHFIATRKLVDSDEEQRLLEEILDASKPVAPTRNSRGPLHYLLYTPFRYPPLNAGGRFHHRLEPSIFYGAEELATAMAEVAYGRFVFMRHSQAQFMPMQVPYTHFVVRTRSDKSIQLNKEPFAAFRALISHPSSYHASQKLGTAMRDAGVELFTYASARRQEGINVGLFSVEAFQQNRPVKGKEGNWMVYITGETVEFQRAHLKDNTKETHVFTRQQFCADGRFLAVAGS